MKHADDAAGGASVRARRSGYTMCRPYSIALCSLLITPLVGSLACAEGPEASARGMVPPRATGTALAVEPVAVIGGASPDGQSVLLNPQSVTRIGSLVLVGDAGASGVRAFTTEGQPVRAFGRQGSGPGEFKQLGSVRACSGDSVFVRDASLHRMTVFDTSGTAVRDYRTPIFTLNTFCAGRGTVALLMRPWGSAPPGTGTLLHAPVLLTDTAGDTIAVIDSVPIGRMLPLAAITSIALASDRLYIGTAESSFVDVYSLSGARQGRIATGVPRRETSQAVKDAYVAQLLDGMYADNPQLRERERQRWLAMPAPSHLPAYRRVLAAPNATLWVDLTAPGDSTTWLRAIAPDGTMLGDAHLPSGAEPLAVDDEYVFVRYEDAQGEPHIALYPVLVGHSTR